MKKRLFLFAFFIIISIIPVFDLFLNTGQPTTFDGIIHISTIAQFSSALQSGDFPVVWLNSFANYGLPVGLFSQQLPIYIGTLMQLFTHNAVLSYNLVLFLGIFLTNVFFYRFLRIYVGEKAAITGVIFLTLAPMHIIDIYIRGDLPEVFAGLFIPLILLSGHMLIVKKKVKGFFLLLGSIAGITLSHPMMLFVGGFFFVPYFVYLFLSEVHFSLTQIFTKKILLRIILAIIAGGVGMGIAAYYIMPLFLEIKYFYFGNEVSHFVMNQYLSLTNLFHPQWYYFTQNDIATRGQFILTGLVEILSLPIALVFLLVNKLHKDKTRQFLLFLLIVSCLMIFFTTTLSSVFYTHIHIFDSLQFPWRFLAVFLFIPPLLYAIVLDKVNKNILFFCLYYNYMYSAFSRALWEKLCCASRVNILSFFRKSSVSEHGYYLDRAYRVLSCTSGAGTYCFREWGIQRRKCEKFFTTIYC